MISSIDNLKGWQKTTLAVVHDLVASAISLLFALSLAFGKFEFLTDKTQHFFSSLFLLVRSEGTTASPPPRHRAPV